MKLENIDIEFLKEKGITPEQLESQLEMLKTGFPYLKLEGACTVGHGITRPSRRMQRRCVSIWDKYVASGASIEKMVPASGAASRMFKNVFAFVNAGKEAADDFMRDLANARSKGASIPFKASTRSSSADTWSTLIRRTNVSMLMILVPRSMWLICAGQQATISDSASCENPRLFRKHLIFAPIKR